MLVRRCSVFHRNDVKLFPGCYKDFTEFITLMVLYISLRFFTNLYSIYIQHDHRIDIIPSI